MGIQLKIILIVLAVLAAAGAAGVGLYYGNGGFDEPEVADTAPGDAGGQKPAGDTDAPAGEDAPAAPTMAPAVDIVRVEPTGDLVAAGRAAAGARIALLLGDKVLTEAIANAEGEWALVLDEPLAPGSYDLVLRATDKDGKAAAEGDRVTVVIESSDTTPLVAMARPGEPMQVLQQPAVVAGADKPAAETAVAVNTNDAPATAAATSPPAADDTAGKGGTDVADASGAAPDRPAKPDQPAADQQAQAQAPAPAPAQAQAQAQAPAAAPASGQSADQAQPAQDAQTADGGEETAPAAETTAAAVAATTQPDAAPNSEPAPTSEQANAGQAISGQANSGQTISGQTTGSEPTSATPKAPSTAAATGESSDGPTEAADDEPVPSGNVTVETVEVEDPDQLMLGGRAEPGDAVRVYLNNERLADVDTDDSGRWMLSTERPMPPGRYEVRADVVGAAGDVTARAQVRFDRVQMVAEDDAAPATDGKSDADQTAAAGQPGSAVTIVSRGTGVGAASADGTVGEGAGTSVVVIARGDNLWRIARKIYGQGVRHSVIYEANRKQIRDPHLIYPGQVFTIPVLEGENDSSG